MKGRLSEASAGECCGDEGKRPQETGGDAAGGAQPETGWTTRHRSTVFRMRSRRTLTTERCNPVVLTGGRGFEPSCQTLHIVHDMDCIRNGGHCLPPVLHFRPRSRGDPQTERLERVVAAAFSGKGIAQKTAIRQTVEQTQFAQRIGQPDLCLRCRILTCRPSGQVKVGCQLCAAGRVARDDDGQQIRLEPAGFSAA